MSLAKVFDTGSSAWVPAIIGAQGSQGPTGSSGAQGPVGPQGPLLATLMEAIPLSVYGHSVTDAVIDEWQFYPPNPKGPRGWQRTWPYRLGRRLGTLDPYWGEPGVRVGGYPGTLCAQTARLMIRGQGKTYDDSGGLFPTVGVGGGFVKSQFQWNPGMGAVDGTGAFFNPGTAADGNSVQVLNPASGYASGGDMGVIMLQCAINDAGNGTCMPPDGTIFTTGIIDVPVAAVAVNVTNNSTTATLQPSLVSATAGNNYFTVVSGPIPNPGQPIYIAGAGAGGATYGGYVSSVSGSTVYLNRFISSAIQTTVSSVNMWTPIYQYDRIVVGANKGVINLPGSSGMWTPTGGNLVIHYGDSSQTVAFNSTPATFVANIASAIQTLLLTQHSGATCSGAVTSSSVYTFTFTNAIVSDLWIDFTPLTATPNGAGTTGMCSGITWTLSNTNDATNAGSYYVTNVAWTGGAAYPTSNSSTCTLTLNTAYKGTTSTGAFTARFLSGWFGVPQSIWGGSGYGGTDFKGHQGAWKNSLRTMLRYARCDVGGLSSDTATSGTATPTGYHNGFTLGGSSSQHGLTGRTNTALISTGTWYYAGSSTPYTSDKVFFETSGGGQQIPNVGDWVSFWDSGSNSPGYGQVIQSGLAYNNSGHTGTGQQAFTLSGVSGLTSTFPYSTITYNILDWVPTADSTAMTMPSNENFKGPQGPYSSFNLSSNNGFLKSTLSGTPTPNYTFNVRDRFGTKEVIALYHSYAYQNPNGSAYSTTWNMNLTGDSWSTYKTFNNTDGFPYTGSRGVFSLLPSSFGTAVANLSTSGGTGTVVIEKAGNGRGTTDASGNVPVSFDGVFTTTSTPPWVVMVAGYCNNTGQLTSRAYRLLQQAYIDVSSEPEFSWYTSVVPPWPVYDSTYLNGGVHPNDKGLTQTAPNGTPDFVTWLGNYLSQNIATYYYTCPTAKVNGNGYTYAAAGSSGLGARLGYP